MVGEERRSEDWVRVSLAWLFCGASILLLGGSHSRINQSPPFDILSRHLLAPPVAGYSYHDRSFLCRRQHLRGGRTVSSHTPWQKPPTELMFVSLRVTKKSTKKLGNVEIGNLETFFIYLFFKKTF